MVAWRPAGARTRSESLRRAIERIVEPAEAAVGVAVLFEEQGEERLVTVGDDAEYPMLSVFKFHVAVAALDRMERERIAPGEKMEIEARRMLADTYSPLRDTNPGCDLSVSYGDLIRYAVSLSDNNACDLLIDFAGGIERVAACIRRTGVGVVVLSETEQTMHADLRNCYRNRTAPSAMVRLMKAVCTGRVLGASQTELLVRAMTETSTGADKMRAGLPAGTYFGHKTGSSDRMADGVKIADNDAGFFRLPDGSMCYVAVFVTDSSESDAANAAIAARVASAVYETLSRAEHRNGRCVPARAGYGGR